MQPQNLDDSSIHRNENPCNPRDSDRYKLNRANRYKSMIRDKVMIDKLDIPRLVWLEHFRLKKN